MRFIKRNGGFSYQRVVQLFCIPLLLLFLTHCSEFQTQPTPAPPKSETSTPLIKMTSVVSPDGSEHHFYPHPHYPGSDLIIYAHGYYSPEEPAWEPGDDEIDGTPFPVIAHELGFSYATTSYRYPGLNVPVGVLDLVSLVEYFENLYWTPKHIYLIGASEGGLITTKAVEEYPHVFSGGMATCGPVGNFQYQIKYLGDFHVVFNYFFPGKLPGDPTNIPQEVIDNWDTYKANIEQAIAANPNKTEQLLRVTDAAVDPADPSSVTKTVTDILWYNVFATNDAIFRLGGKPFDNRWKWYSGSNNDWRLNFRIKRYRAEQVALNTIEQDFQTSGDLSVPLVMLHTTADPVVPYWHEPLYRLKIFANGSGLMHTNIPIIRYGHCEFEMQDVLAGFAVLVFKVALQDLFVPQSLLPYADEQAEFLQTAEQFGTEPKIIYKVER
jgi:pimeloyl-ACP methyl ester carboxylesterase